jgi:large subunit ribosomal protein L29
MKNSEIRGLSLEELQSKLTVEKDNYEKLKFAHSITPIENPMKIKESRKLVARIQTEIRAKQNINA